VTRAVAPGKRNGYYVDVGAADGEAISNTKLLDDLGWKGICIDPFPTNMGQRSCQVVRQPVFSESGKRVQFRPLGIWAHRKGPGPLQGQGLADSRVELVTATLDEILARRTRQIHRLHESRRGGADSTPCAAVAGSIQIGSLTIEHNYEMDKAQSIHNSCGQRLRARALLGSGRLVRASQPGPPLRSFIPSVPSPPPAAISRNSLLGLTAGISITLLHRRQSAPPY